MVPMFQPEEYSKTLANVKASIAHTKILFSNQGAQKRPYSLWLAFLQVFTKPNSQGTEASEIPPNQKWRDLVISKNTSSVLCFLIFNL